MNVVTTQSIQFVDDYANLYGDFRDLFKIYDRYYICLVDKPVNQVTKDIYGFYTYTKDNLNREFRQDFLLTFSSSLYSNQEVGELKMVLNLGSVIENRYKKSNIIIERISLPRSHKFHGNSYNYNDLKIMFPKLL